MKCVRIRDSNSIKLSQAVQREFCCDKTRLQGTYNNPGQLTRHEYSSASAGETGGCFPGRLHVVLVGMRHQERAGDFLGHVLSGALLAVPMPSSSAPATQSDGSPIAPPSRACPRLDHLLPGGELPVERRQRDTGGIAHPECGVRGTLVHILAP